jgi:hypothetical protein
MDLRRIRVQIPKREGEGEEREGVRGIRRWFKR